MVLDCIFFEVRPLYLFKELFFPACTNNHSFFNIFPMGDSPTSFVLDGSYFFLKFSAYFQYRYFQCEISISFAYKLEEDCR
jgi:hypothetical protein